MATYSMWISAYSFFFGFLPFCVSEGEILLVVDGNNVIRSDAWGSQLDYVITNVDGIDDLDFDLITDTLYWTNPGSGKIQRAYIGGDVDASSVQVQDFITTDIGYLDSVAVDWLNRNLYWTDQELGQISVVGLNGAGRKVVVNGINDPHKIVVEPDKGNLYWIDKGNTSQDSSTIKIETSKLDGTGRTVLVGSELQTPTALAIDYSDPRSIYWADTAKNNIQKSATSGWSRRVVITSQTLYNGEQVVLQTESLSLGSQYMYWAETNRKLIFYTTKSGSQAVKVIEGNFVQPTSVHVFHDYRQPVDRCSLMGGCDADVHVCADDPSGPYLCSCMPGTEYNEDTKKCENVDECHKGMDKCLHICIDTEASYNCSCVSGYELINVTNCVDINECERNTHQCTNICDNVEGSYTCNCQPGLKLQPDGLSCQWVTCPNTLTYPNVIVECGSGPYHVGHTCTLGCSSGRLFGPTTIFCGPNGEWLELSELPFCYGGSQEEINWNTFSIEVTPSGIAENSPLHTIVGNISLIIPAAYGQIPLQSVHYSLVTTGVPFAVEDTSTMAALTLTGLVNHEKQSLYNITLKAELKYNDVQHTITSRVTIGIINVNEPPPEPQLSRYSVPETLHVGGVVGKFISDDPDKSDIDPTKPQRLKYSLLSAIDSKGKSVTIFDDQDNQGIVLWGRLNYETDPYYTLTIKVQDTGTPPLSATAKVNITVFDVNEPPTDISLSGTEIQEIAAESRDTVYPMIGTLTAIDPDNPAGESHTYKVIKDDLYDRYVDCFIVSNTTLSNGTNVFALYPKDATCFDYEKSVVIETTLEVADKNGLTFQKSFRISVLDVNERPSNIYLTGFQVMEHSPVGMFIGMVLVRDPDRNDGHTLSLLYSTNNWISLHGSALKISGDIDFEEHRTIVVTMRATDSSGLQLTKNLTVYVENVRHGPQIVVDFLSDYQCEEIADIDACISENLPGDGVVATVTVLDTEENKTVIMWLTDTSGSFRLSDGSIRVKPKKLNYESGVRNIAIKLTAIDRQGDKTVHSIKVKVLDANDQPKEVRLSNSILTSDAAVGDTVGTLTCVDEDYSDTHNFTLKKNPGSLFELEGNLLKISGNLKNGTEFPIILTCTDGESTSTNSHFTIEKSTDQGSDVVISLSQTVAMENIRIGSIIGTISVSSNDPHNMFHISLEEAEFLPFQTTNPTAMTADLMVAGSLDFENKAEYDIVIKAFSLITHSMAFQSFTIKVLNVPEEIEIDSLVFKECPASSLMVEVTIMDPALNTQYLFSVINSVLPLQITNVANTTAILTNYEALDYENETMGGGQDHNLTIQVADFSNVLNKVLQTFTVKIVNVNEAPISVSLYNWTVLENTKPRTVVSQLIVHDPDSSMIEQKFYCDFIRNDFGWFIIDNSLKIKVQNQAVIDYEHPQFPVNTARHVDHVVVECWDQGGLSVVSETLELEIIDVYEEPTEIKFTGKQLTVAENLPKGTMQYISSFTVTDVDQDDSHQLEIIPRNAKHVYPDGLFVFNGSALYVTESLNYENRASYKVKITATDKGGLALTKKFQIYVLDKNDPPTRVYVPSYAHILEHKPIGSVLTYLYTEDEDFDQGHAYVLLNQSPQYAVQLVENNKIAVLSPDVLDYEIYQSINLTIQSIDQGVPSMNITNSFTIPIVNVNEAPTAVILSSNQVSEGAPSGTVVGNISIVDPDEDVTSPLNYFFFLMDSAQGRFTVDYNWELDIYQLLINSGGDSLNYELQSSYNITLFTIDFGTTLTTPVTIDLIDQNDPPKGLLFELPTEDMQVPAEPDVTEFVSMKQEDISGIVTVPESTGLSVAASTPLAYMYVVDEDMLHSSVDMTNYKFTISTAPPSDQTGSRKRREVNPRVKRMSNPDFTSPTVSSFSVQSQKGARWLGLWSNLTLDYEAQSQYEFYITCTDTTASDMSVTQKVSLIVKNVEELPYSVLLDNNTVKENSDRSNKLGSLMFLDQDQATASYMVSVVHTPNNSFYLSGMDLYTRRQLDYENKASYLVNISVSEVGVNQGDLEYYSLQVLVLDQPEPPCCLTFADTGYSRKWLPSSVAMGDTVGMLSVFDPDSADSQHMFDFQILSAVYQTADYTSYFKVINHNQLIISQQLPDTSTRAVYEILIRTVDSSGLGFKARVYVSFLGGCDGHQCPNSATCVSMDDGSSSCQCNQGFTGSGEVCTAINACETNPCVNGGECFSGSRGTYLCNCSTQFTGLHCEVSKSQCTGVSCPYNGVCVPLQKAYSCQCVDPYRRDCSGCIQGKTKDGVCDASNVATNDKLTSDQSSKGMPGYVPIVISVVVILLILTAVIIAVVVYLRKRRHWAVHRGMRYNSDESNLNVISGDLDYKDGIKPSQFANPLYEQASISTNGGIHPSDSKAPLEDLEPTNVNLDMNKNPPDFTRTLSQQEEILFYGDKESSP